MSYEQILVCMFIKT